MALVTSKTKAEFDRKELAKRAGEKDTRSQDAKDFDLMMSKAKNSQRVSKKLEEEKHFSEKPMAAEGLNSYRYQGRYGHIMIGAKDHEDALREAQRSTRDKVEHKHLESWDEKEGKYKSVM